MSGSIPFSQIPPNLRVPLFYAEFSNSGAGISQAVQRTLIIGQTVAAQPAVPTFIPSLAWAQAAYGANSQLANMIAGYRANDTVGEIWALPLADAASSTAATGTIALTGTATANGTLSLLIGGTAVQVGVASGQAAATIATAIVAAVNANVTLPTTASASSGTVTLTSDNKGTLGNDIPIVLNYYGAQGGQSTPAGITVAITGMSGGATDPTLTGTSLATALGIMPFDFIVNPYHLNLAATSALLSDQAGRWNYAQQLYGHAFSAVRDTVANLLTAGAALNDQHLTVLGVNGNSPTPAWLWAPAFVGTIAPSIKVQPNRPVQFLSVAGVLAEPAGLEIGFANQQALLSAGIALCQRTTAGGVQVLRAVTTYQTNSAGTPDTSYLDTETLFTLMLIVRTLKGVITQKFPRALLADDGTPLAPTPPGDTPVVITPSVARNELIVQYRLLCAQNLCQDPTAFAAGLIVQRNANDNSRLDVLFDPYLVSGLRVFAMLTEFFFQAPLAQAA